MRFFSRGRSVPAAPETSGAPAFAVIDVETTGLYPATDRVVEIAVVRLDAMCAPIDEWVTVVDPCRDVGPTRIHGLTAGDVRGAPRFEEIALHLRCRLGGTILAAHNATFDRTFLAREFARAGIPLADDERAFCTMWGCCSNGLTSSRSLSRCCAELGVRHDDVHTALGDARASAMLLRVILAQVGRDHLDLPSPVCPLTSDVPPVPVRLRGDPPPPRIDRALGSLADRVCVPSVDGASPEAAMAYLALLDRILEDRVITDEEVRALAAIASEWGIGSDAIRTMHRAYLGGAWELAMRDGVVTRAERADLAAIAELLGVPLGDAQEPDASLRPVLSGARPDEFAGKSVCFTGESVCSIRGIQLDRADQEDLAIERGMVVKANVSRRLDLLVLADPDSQSGKARKATELGVRRMTEPAFWRALGVDID